MRSDITDQDLEHFANSKENSIEFRECHSNSYKVYLCFDGVVHWGEATFVDAHGGTTRGGHFWNVLKLMSDSMYETEQIIDIYNYKNDRKGIYIDHQSWGEYSIDILKNVVINNCL